MQGATAAPLFVEVAVPLPLPGTLTYAVPVSLAARLERGARVRVQVGRRRVTGIVWALAAEAPSGVEIKPLEALLDLEPIVPLDLLELARFASDYYFASPGETVAAMISADQPAWGDRVVALTPAGALASPRDPTERQLLDALLEKRRSKLSELLTHIADVELAERVEEWIASGRLVDLAARRRAQRYLQVVSLAAGSVADLRERAGRSPAGRAVVDFLAALGRPAAVAEIRSETGASEAVIGRLARLGVALRIQEPRRLPLDRHLLRAGDGDGSTLTLLDDQAAALAAIRPAIASRRFERFLLHGVTGSGKSEVYLRAAQAAVELGRSALLLVPEIALVPAFARAARDRFGDRLAVLHSALSASERSQEWDRIRKGEAPVVIGPRSALFAPVRDLGLAVVDEEQDPSYKQESTPRYHGRDLALVRCRQAGAVALLGSATPSLEARAAAERGGMQLLRLSTRVGSARLPEGILVDLRSEPRVRRPGEITFSGRLLAELEETLARGDQAILLRNRRGYSPILLCRACGEEFRCEACGLPRTFHRRARRLLCHWCGSSQPAPERCPTCDADTLDPIGSGTERIEEELGALFPKVQIAVLDRDAAQRHGGAAAILERFKSGETQILVGTQMLSKGHHFPRVTLTAVLNADAYLGFPDFRAVERTYALLTQLAGRAGRGERAGRVVFQTHQPDHYAIRAALAHDDETFARQELRFRRIFDYPPYSRMAIVGTRDRDRDRGLRRLHEMAERLARFVVPGKLRVNGPAPAPLERLRGEWRFQLVVRSPTGRRLREAVRSALPTRHDPALFVDVDPYQML